MRCPVIGEKIIRLCRKPKIASLNHEGHEGHEEGISIYLFFYLANLRDLRVLRGQITRGRIFWDLPDNHEKLFPLQCQTTIIF
jgi:hypothetical protein